ncbi:MAG TPA: hypothetical protein VFU81_20180 [Thermomicrobiales bacterium]|nr:hypothetical protein [Thermomicrobiales bacterium]
MDDPRFDRLARALGASATRRGAQAALLGGGRSIPKGGGILNAGDDLTLTDVIVQNNTAGAGGHRKRIDPEGHARQADRAAKRRHVQ